METALSGDHILASTREKVRALLGDDEVIALFTEVERSLGASPNWRKVQFTFFEILADVAGDPPEEIKGRLTKACQFLFEEASPNGSEHLSGVLGAGNLQVGVDPRSGEGRLLETYKGIEIRAADMEWRKDQGVYVGPPHKNHGMTIYHRDFVSQLDKEKVRKSLAGQVLYVDSKDVQEARWLVDEFRLTPGPCFSHAAWCQMLRRGAGEKLSLSLTGVILKQLILDRPGGVGNLARSLPCCALENFQRNTAELLPLPLPEFSDDEKAIEEAVRAKLRGTEELGLDAWEAMKSQAKRLGQKTWQWLQILVMNYLYCQGVGNRMLTEGMLHAKKPTKAQEMSLERIRRISLKWLENDQEDAVMAESWERLAESLGDMYTGPSLGKSFPLTLAVILPTTPGEGEAARIPLAEVVSAQVKPYVDDPGLLRIPDEELVAPRTSAKVQVTSQEEWDKIVERLVDSGMLEREVEAETLVYKGEPVRNGAFGVHKAWVLQEDGSWFRTLRLIINMIPGNSFQRRMPERASERMGYAPLWGNLLMHEDEIILGCAEDQRHCFHIYRPGYAWRSFFSLNRRAAGKSFKDGVSEPGFPRVKSAPMGWNNVVDFIQDGFENMAKEAGLAAAQMIRMGEPSPMKPLETPRSFYSFYVDNFDELQVVWRTDRGLYEGKPSDSQLKLRRKMEELSVGRDPKKAAEGEISWKSLGAEVDGDLGWVGSALSFRCALASANLGLMGGELVRTDSPNLQSVVSKNMHSVQYCRPLSCLMDHLYVDLNATIPRQLSEDSRDELLLLTCALPLHWQDIKMKVSGQVYATDASPDGGGACSSIGLSPWGSARLQSLSHEVDGIEGSATEKAVVIEVFAGMGGLKQALDLLGFEPMGVIAIDSSPECAKVYKQHCRHCIWYKDVQSITEKDVLQWREKFSKATMVTLGGGWPCVNHSQLNVNRQGASGATSLLLDAMLKIREWLETSSTKVGLPAWRLVEMYENVVMDDEDYRTQTRKIGFSAHYVEAAQVGRCRRPRLYWVKGVDILQGDDLTVTRGTSLRDHDYLVKKVTVDTERPPLSWYLSPGADKMEEPEEPFATFTRPIPRQQPPPEPAGLDKASEKALRRWRGDSFRLAPYQYEPRNLVVDANGPRRPTPEEQLRMLGFASNHLNTKARLSVDAKGQLVGNSFSAVVVARLLAGLVLKEDQCQGKDLTLAIWHVWKAMEDKAQQEDKPWKVRFASVAAGVSGVVSLASQVLPSAALPLRPWVDPQEWLNDEEMLAYLLARAGTHRGGEIRVDLGMPYSVGELCRQSIDPGHWLWKVLLSYQWKQKDQHINVLELVAVLDLLRRLGRDGKCHSKRMVTLVDNQVAVSCITKGRSSARALQGPLRRISAVCLAGHFRLCLGWIKSKWNPADGPSRWAKKRQGSHA